MRLFLIALLFAISYAQTGYTESGVYRHCSAPQHFELGSNCDHTILSGTTCDLHFICPENMFSNPVPRTCQEDSTWAGEPLDPNCHDIECLDQAGYQMFETGGCSGHNKLGIYFESLDECAQRCENEDSCVSFEYSKSWDNHPEPHRCALSATCTYDFSRQALNDQNCLYVKGMDVPANDATQSGSSGGSNFPYIHCPIPEHFSSTCDGTILLGTTCELFFLCPERKFSYRAPQICQEDSTWHGEPLDPNCYDTEDPTVNPTQNPSEQITTSLDDAAVDVQESDDSDKSTGKMIIQICVYSFAVFGILSIIYCCCCKLKKSNKTFQDDEIAKPEDSPEGNINGIGVEFQYHGRQQCVDTPAARIDPTVSIGSGDVFSSRSNHHEGAMNDMPYEGVSNAENTQRHGMRQCETPEGTYPTGMFALLVEEEAETTKCENDGTSSGDNPTQNDRNDVARTKISTHPDERARAGRRLVSHESKMPSDTAELSSQGKAEKHLHGTSAGYNPTQNDQNDVARPKILTNPDERACEEMIDEFDENIMKSKGRTLSETMEEVHSTVFMDKTLSSSQKEIELAILHNPDEGADFEENTQAQVSRQKKKKKKKKEGAKEEEEEGAVENDQWDPAEMPVKPQNVERKTKRFAWKGSKERRRRDWHEEDRVRESKRERDRKEDKREVESRDRKEREKLNSTKERGKSSRDHDREKFNRDQDGREDRERDRRSRERERKQSRKRVRSEDRKEKRKDKRKRFETQEDPSSTGTIALHVKVEGEAKSENDGTSASRSMDLNFSQNDVAHPKPTSQPSRDRRPSFGDAHLLFEQTCPPSVRPLPPPSTDGAPGSSATGNTSPRAHTPRYYQGKASN